MPIGDQEKKKKAKPHEPQTILDMTELRWFALRIVDSKRHVRDIYALMNNKKKVFLVALQTGTNVIQEPVLTPALEQVEGLKPAKLTAGTICAAPEWLEDKIAALSATADKPLEPSKDGDSAPMPSMIGGTSIAEEEEADESTTAGTTPAGKDGGGSGDVPGERAGQA